MKKTKTPFRISGPPPAHRVEAMYKEKIAALEKEVNHLRNWWWVDMMDRPRRRECGQDDRRSEIYTREHWLRGMELARNGWVEADFAREQMWRADVREKEREAKKSKEEAEKAKQELAAAQIELAVVKSKLEEKKEQDAVDRQLAMTLMAATQ